MAARTTWLAVLVAAALVASLGGAGACASFGEDTRATGDGGTGSDGAPSADALAGEAGGSPYVQAVREDKPIGYWRFGDATGALARTLVGGPAFDGIVKGGAVFGQPGAIKNDPDTALDVDGDNRVVEVSEQLDFAATASFTLEIWVKLTGLDGTYRHLFTKDFTPATGREEYAIYVQTADNDANQALAFERIVGGKVSTAELRGPAPNTVTLGVWHHVVAVYDGSNMLLYLDSVMRAAAKDTAPQVHKAAPLFIGAKARNYGSVRGTLDEAAVYDKPLSAERIALHYQLGTLGAKP